MCGQLGVLKVVHCSGLSGILKYPTAQWEVMIDGCWYVKGGISDGGARGSANCLPHHNPSFNVNFDHILIYGINYQSFKLASQTHRVLRCPNHVHVTCHPWV